LMPQIKQTPTKAKSFHGISDEVWLLKASEFFLAKLALLD